VCQSFLRELDLAPFGTIECDRFKLALDRSTEALKACLPESGRDWGLARKAMNIFLRDAFYTTYLETQFNLQRAEHLFEIPLDSFTANALRKTAGGMGLPRWDGVKYLTSELNDGFQKVAETEARKQGIARVHLDAFWWSQERDTD
jgi:hypothetical protein